MNIKDWLFLGVVETTKRNEPENPQWQENSIKENFLQYRKYEIEPKITSINIPY